MWRWIGAAIAVGAGLLVQFALHEQHPHPGKTLCGARKLGLIVVGDDGLSHGLLDALEGLNQSRTDFCGADLHVAAVGNHRGYIEHIRGLSWENVRAIQNHTIGGFELTLWEGLHADNDLQHKDNLAEVVKDLAAFGHFDKYVIVDCSESSTSASGRGRGKKHVDELVLGRELGMGVVVANLQVLSGPYKQYARLVPDTKARRSRLIALDSAFGKGLPVLTVLQRLQSTGDQINRIEGTFSDAVGHIFAEMHKGSSWSDAVSTVYENGLTEDDPRDDLAGVILARKALAIARHLGRDLELANVTIHPLISPAMKEGNIHEFLQKIEAMNADMAKKWKEAVESKQRLAYIATIDERGIRVGLESIEAQHPLFAVKYVDSVAHIATTTFPHGIVLHLSKPNAEGSVSAVLADIAKLSCVHFSKCDG